jgi:signal transduction histidine kinase
MKLDPVRVQLFLAILIMAALPLVAAFYLLTTSLQTSLNLGFNSAVVQSLDDSAQNLKALKRLDPEGQERYREQFGRVERLQRVYSQPELLKSNILASLRIYFGLGLASAVVLSVVLAALLGRSIAGIYQTTFDELMRHRQRVRYLEEMGSWQELAKMLAHEIKNPLTPIEVLITSLSKAYRSRTEHDFQAQLDATQAMIVEELDHLKSTVSRFSEFAKLPAVQLATAELTSVIAQLAKSLTATFEAADIKVDEVSSVCGMRAAIDTTLLRQALANIVRNGIEANPGRRVGFTITLTAPDDALNIAIANDGLPVPSALAARIFDPYVSGKVGGDNMGLGLAIVKKIVLEHGGDVSYAEERCHPLFTISLPRIAT